MINFTILENPIRYHIDFISSELKYPLNIYFINKRGDIFWQTQINSQNTWVQSPPSTTLDVRVIDSDGDVVFSYDWIYNQLCDIVEKKFIDWCRNFITNFRNKPTGIVIGTNDGSEGEWVVAHKQHLIGETLLIEPNLNSFLTLTTKYSENENFSFKRCAISETDGEVDFYTNESETLESSSLLEDHYLKHKQEFKIVKVRSFSPNTLLNDNLPDWIHIDAEGYDAKIILMIDDDKLSKIKFLMWEHIHISNELSEKINHKLNNIGFEIIKGDGYNSCAYKIK